MKAFLAVIACVYLTHATTEQASAQSLLQNTFLLDVRQGSGRSDLAARLSKGGYELEDGTPIDFATWYTPRMPELSIVFLTAITPRWGVTWGLSTGERGQKYRIDPGVWIGFVYRHEISKHSVISLSASTLLGGNFRERTCEAFYSVSQSFETVNCRLAATFLQPRDTLKFLETRSGRRETRASLRYEFRF
jgi:hypothetical protein